MIDPDIDSDTDSELLIRLAFLLSDINEHIEEAFNRGIDLKLEYDYKHGIGEQLIPLYQIYTELKATTLL